jgi:hypothetical protein
VKANAALNTFFDDLVEAVAERVVAKLGQAKAPTVYTTHKNGPHIPRKTRRWMVAHIKDMPGARKVGRDWEISASDYEAWAKAEDARRCREGGSPYRPLATAALSNSDDEVELRRRADRTLEVSGFRRTR